jgi:small conductance mechanosensitive channel
MWKYVEHFLQSLGSFTLDRLIPTIIISVVGLLLIRLIMAITGKLLKKTKMDNPVLNLLRSVIRVVLYILLSLICASALGLDVTGVVALASVLTLAVSLSLQDALANVIGGFTLLTTKPFSMGDFVEVAGQTGTVQTIGLNYTKLTTTDNKTVSIPNAQVVAAEIVNYTVAGTRRTDITVYVSSEHPAKQVMDALTEAATVPTALAEKPVSVVISDYAQGAVVYLLQVWSKSSDYWTTTCQTKENIKTIFERENISMCYQQIKIEK